ncbi:MAG: PAS domain-containing protein [Pigmentiphaga sp.]|uniref:sensor histidine kinase n=1 Tax=Pigmentiphaga sp. TaxID=1977564 RepID=UPI0029B00109|nr:ATP-binding protein [Pigmentiphaga sp.]MDX3904130.1 PAS domain-containing protein [Pigmentiphaga sp.]
MQQESAAAEPDRQVLAAALESLPAAAWVVDRDGCYRYVSEAYARLMGTSPALCLGKHMEEVMPASLARIYALRHRQLIDSGARKRFEQIWTVDGEPRWFEVHMSCLCDGDGQAVAVSGFAQDVTQHMEQQEAARRVQNELEKRVARRTHQLSIINEELEAFSYSVSHDLRAPLRQIAGFAELLEGRLGDQIDEAAAQYLHHIVDNTRRMDGLIGDLLQLARINQGGLLKTQVDLTAIARDVLAGLRNSQPERPVELELPGPSYADCDPGLMRIALDNLLGNAWKFTGCRAEPRIQFGCFARGACTVYFVRDNGAGFDLQNAERLFGAFQRFHRASDFPGTGVGLATVRRIINRHGGQIWAESAPGQGATFYFTLETPN